MNERRLEREARMRKAEETGDLSWISDLQSLPTESERQDWLRGESFEHKAASSRRGQRRIIGWFQLGIWLVLSGVVVAILYATGVI